MNNELIENFNILQKYYKKEGDTFRTRAYSNAVSALKKIESEITDIKQLKNVRNIGKSSRDKIKEYLTTGKIEKVEEIKQSRTEKEKTLELFEGIYDVGEKTALKLWEKGYRKIENIPLSSLTKNQIIGVKYYEDLRKRIQREYITIFQIMVRVILNLEFGVGTYKMDVAGSYRRKKKTSGDIDILLSSETFILKEAIDVLNKWNVVTDILSMKSEKFMGVCHCPSGNYHNIRVDIVFLPEEQYGAGLLYFTGSKEFNVDMRFNAKKQGLRLNQHGLFDEDGELIPTYTERDIFDVLDMKYVEPEYR